MGGLWTSVAISSFHSLLTKSSVSRRQNNGVCRDVENAYIDSGSVLLFLDTYYVGSSFCD